MLIQFFDFAVILLIVKALIQPLPFQDPNLTINSTRNSPVPRTGLSREKPDPPDDTQKFEIEGSLFNIWYGSPISFGELGQPQPWVNILGNLTDTSDVTALSYTLNWDSPISLSIGSDSRRLVNRGDFNIDLSASDLSDGLNTVIITAQDFLGNTSNETISVDYSDGTIWPLPYNIDWSTVTSDVDIQDVAQIVDGKWTITQTGIRTAKPGYDRLVAIGDRTWNDYEVTVPVTIHSIFSESYGVGLVVRWDGHTDSPVTCSQPKCGWEPLGDIGWITELGLKLYYGGRRGFSWDPNTEYMLKMRVETSGVNTTYSLKSWNPKNHNEPSEWGVNRTTSNTPARGSVMLIAHMVDVTFGDVTIEPIGDPINYLRLPLIIR
ncbi:hypothetical protein ACFLV7_05225 [Chloroflexota bacterium]